MPQKRKSAVSTATPPSVVHSSDDGASAAGLARSPNQTDLDYLINLLQVAAAIEHELMVQYLYAAYSLGGEQIPEAARDEVQTWRRNILSIAKEEMGHFMTVQNVLTVLGGAILWDRGNHPRMDTIFPLARKELSPLTKESLALYVFAEAPTHLDEKKNYGIPPAKVREIIKAARHAVHGEPNHVGWLYQEIMRIIKDPTLIPDSAFHPETYPLQASWEEWGKGYIPYKADPESGHAGAETVVGLPAIGYSAHVILAQVASRTQVVDALNLVLEQGENADPNDKDQPSHFERFVLIYDGFEKAAKKKWSPTRHLPVNPTTDPNRQNAAYIENAHSRDWAHLFNLRYRMLLTYLAHSYRLAPSTETSEPQMRAGTLHRVFSEMYNLKALSSLLNRLPLTNKKGDKRRAGPPFELPYTLELPASSDDSWRLCRLLLVESETVCRKIMPDAPDDGKRYLIALRELDTQSIAWIDTVLDAGSTRRARA